ncbi:MAG: ABC transporter ATP-binding protein, partial [Burkholderiales bacterium]
MTDTHGRSAGSLPRPFAGSRRGLLLPLLAIAVAQAAIWALTPLLVHRAFALSEQSPGSAAGPAELATIAALLGCAAIAAGWLRAHERASAERLGQSLVHALRLALFDRLLALSARTVQRRARGGDLLRFIGDLGAIRRWIAVGFVRLLVGSLIATGALGALAWIDPWLAAAVFVVLALTVAAMATVGTRLRAASRQARRARARLAGDISERIESLTTIRQFSQSRRERRRIGRRSAALRTAMIRRARLIGALRGLTEGAGGITVAVALLVGLAASGGARLGAVAAAMTVLGLLVSTLRELGPVLGHWHDYRLAMERIDALARAAAGEREPNRPPLPESGAGALELRGVGYGDALHAIDLVIPAASRVALAGASGSGKSTLLQLLAGQIEPDRGEIVLDGCSLSRHRIDSMRARVGLFSPPLPLMRGTVRRNVRYRRPRADDAELAPVLARVALGRDDPNFLDRRVAPRGENLSAGQRHRIALARACVGDPDLLLIDDTDAMLDADSRSALSRVIERHPGTV